MTNKIIFGLIIALILSSCSNVSDSDIKRERGQFFGFYMSNSARHGRPSDSFFNISTTITNDTLIPFHLQISFLKEYSHNNKKYKIVLLPESMTVDKLRDDDFFKSEVLKFLESEYEKPSTINKIIKPKENYTINIAFISGDYSNFVPGQLALISKLHKFHFTTIPDSLIVQEPPTADTLQISLGLNFSILTDSIYGFKLIPCGKIYYSN
jgi:hypothetical protein